MSKRKAHPQKAGRKKIYGEDLVPYATRLKTPQAKWLRQQTNAAAIIRDLLDKRMAQEG